MSLVVVVVVVIVFIAGVFVVFVVVLQDFHCDFISLQNSYIV